MLLLTWLPEPCASRTNNSKEETMTKLDFALSRRHLLRGASAAGALGAFGSLNSVLAKAPMLGTQAPCFLPLQARRFRGDHRVGRRAAARRSPQELPRTHPEETDRQLSENFLPTDNTVLEQNALIVNTGDKLILFDTGLGNLRLFGPTTGRLQSSLKAGGHGSQGGRCRGDDPCPYRPLGGNRPGRRNEQFPECAVLHHPG